MADEIKLKAPTVEQQVVVNISGEEKLKAFSDTLDKISNNKNLQKYWKTQQELINATSEAYGNFQKKTSQDNASELIKIVNALKAVSGTDLSNILPNFDKISKGLTDAQKIVGSIDSAFSVKSFKEAFDSFEALEAYGTDVTKVLQRLGTSADVDELRNQIDDLSESLENAGKKIERLRDRNSSLSDELYEVKSGSRVTKLEEQLEELRSLKDRTIEEFKQSLGHFGFDEHQFDLDPYITNIEYGVYSAKGALADFKSDYRYLFEDAFNNNQNIGTDQFDKLESSLTEVLKVVQETSAGIKELQNQIDMFSVPGIEDDFKGSDESLKQILNLFGQINDSLSSLRSIISDVGDGEEFSPLLKTIKEITTAVDTLSKSVSNIGLNVNIESGGMDQKLLSSLDAKKQSLLSAYKTQFDAMRAFKPSGATVAMANPENRSRIAALNKQINNFDGGASTDNIDQRITAYKEVIKLMKEVSQLSYGKDIYSDMDSSFKNAVSSATGQVTRVQNELKKANTDVAGLENIFGSQDLSKVVEQLGRIADQFENIAKAASEFKAKFADGIKVESSVQEIETLTKKVKELEKEISKLKTGSETNISTPKNTTPDTAGASADDSKVSIGGEGKAADEAGKSFNKASQAKQEFVDVNKKVKQSAESSADAVKKEAEAAKQVDFTPNTEGFDEIVAKFKDFQNYRDQIEKITKISNRNKDGKYDVSYNAKLKSGSSISVGENSAPQVLRANEVVFDAKKIEKATIVNKDLANAIGKVREQSELARQSEEKRQELAQSKAINKALEQEYKDREKLVDSIANGREQTEKLRQSEEKRQELAQSKAINKALEQEYQERKKNQKAADAQLEKDKKRALEFTKNSSKKLSDAVTKYSYGDSTAATNWTKQLNTGLQNFGDFSNINGKISKLSGSVERVIANLKRSHETALAVLKEEINQETTLQNQKDSFNKSNLNAIDAEIKKREEEGKVFSNMLKEQMDSREKILSGIQKSIETYEKKYNDRSATPADYNQSDTYKKNLGNLSDAINNLKEYKATLAGVSSITDEQKSTISSLTAKCEECANAFKSMSAAQKGSTDLSREKLYSKIGEYLQKNSGMAKEFKVQLKALQKQLENDGPNANVSDLTAQFIRLQSQIREAGQEGRSLLDIINDKAFYGFAAQIAGMFSVQDGLRLAQNAINTVVELDTALVDLKKTTSMTSTELNKFYYDANDVAKQMGVTTQEIIEQASAWSRLGYSSKEASTEMARLSSKFAAISPGMDTTEAQEGLVSIMKAFDVETSEVESKIINKINVLGNKFAENNQDVVEGLKRSSAAMAAMNQSFEDTAALFTGGMEILQDAESMGTALRTLSMRMRGYSEETGELDNELVNLKGDVLDLTKTANNAQGISIFTDATQQHYKSMVQYLGEIADEWDQISEVNQTALLQKLFGKNRAQAGAAILGNFDQVRKAIQEMEDSAGSADREMEAIESSLEFKINRLKETWVGTAQQIADRGDIGKGIDALYEVSEAIGFIIDKVRILNIGIVGLTAALGRGRSQERFCPIW